MEFSNVSPDQIDLDDRLFFLENINVANIRSQKIQTVFNPIWVQELTTDKYRIVDGFFLIEQTAGAHFQF